MTSLGMWSQSTSSAIFLRNLWYMELFSSLSQTKPYRAFTLYLIQSSYTAIPLMRAKWASTKANSSLVANASNISRPNYPTTTSAK